MEPAGWSGVSSQSPQQRLAGPGGCTHLCGFTPSSEGRPWGSQVRWAGVQGERLAGCLSGSRGGVLRGVEGTESEEEGRPAPLRSGLTHSHANCASGRLPQHTPTMDPDHPEPAVLGPKSKMRGGRGGPSADG